MWGLSRRRYLRASLLVLVVLAIVLGSLPTSALGARAVVAPAPSPIAAVIQLTVVRAERAATVVRELFPHLRVRIDGHANALVVMGPPDDVQSARTVISGIDVKSPNQPSVEVIDLHVLKPKEVIARIAPLFPGASLSEASKSSILLRSTPLDNAQVKALIASLDVPPASAPPPTPAPVEAIEVKRALPRSLARAVVHQIPRVQVSVSGSTILIKGDTQDVTAAKALVTQLDVPPFGARYTDIYRLKNVDANSVGDLVQRTYPDTKVTVDKDLNAISVYATAAEHERISDAISQLDGTAQNSSAGGGATAAYNSSNIEVIHLANAIPGANNAPSTSAQDIATAVTQALGQMAPGLHVTVPNNSDEIILAGDPTSIRLAKELIAKLDVAPPLVELDTEVLEVDENAVRNVGLQLPGAVLSTTFTEIQPTPDPNGAPGRIGKVQPITRTPLALTAQLNLLVQNGNGRVLADPRIATLSGHTATIRAGDTLAILTTTGGGVGTPVTQQLQTFNTGVTLDITPEVSGEQNDITVALHPVVNSLSGILNGVPQIATRDTQTVVHLRDNQTLVIGGLIQEADTRSISSIPFFGQLPLIGGLFRNKDTNVTRNELVIVVTPHILHDGESPPAPNATMGLPTAQPLPTLPPDASLPSQRNGISTPTPMTTPVLFTPTPPPTPVPAPTPSGFAATNVYEFGSAPQNNYAGPQDPVQIYYVRLQPTVITANTNITINAVTTTNVKSVSIGTLGHSVLLSNLGGGKWSATFPAAQLSLQTAQTSLLSLTATRVDGTASSIQIPVSLSAH